MSRNRNQSNLNRHTEQLAAMGLPVTAENVAMLRASETRTFNNPDPTPMKVAKKSAALTAGWCSTDEADKIIY